MRSARVLGGGGGGFGIGGRAVDGGRWQRRGGPRGNGFSAAERPRVTGGSATKALNGIVCEADVHESGIYVNALGHLLIRCWGACVHACGGRSVCLPPFRRAHHLHLTAFLGLRSPAQVVPQSLCGSFADTTTFAESLAAPA